MDKKVLPAPLLYSSHLTVFFFFFFSGLTMIVVFQFVAIAALPHETRGDTLKLQPNVSPSTLMSPEFYVGYR
jgi:hypothetical protein